MAPRQKVRSVCGCVEKEPLASQRKEACIALKFHGYCDEICNCEVRDQEERVRPVDGDQTYTAQGRNQVCQHKDGSEPSAYQGCGDAQDGRQQEGTGEAGGKEVVCRERMLARV